MLQELNRQALQAYEAKVNEFNSQLQALTAQNTALVQQQADCQAQGQAQLAVLQATVDASQQQAQFLLAQNQTLETQKQASDAKIAEYEAQRLTTQSQQSLPPDAASPPFALLQSPGKGLSHSIALAQSSIRSLEKQNRELKARLRELPATEPRKRRAPSPSSSSRGGRESMQS